MIIKDYLNYTGDTIEDIESMASENGTVNKVSTRFGNVLYWEQESGKVIYAEWRVPKDNRIDKLDEDALDKISGQYYLISYGENMERAI